jgi:hypothetical protein
VTPLDLLADEPRWVAWRNEDRGRKPTKIPYAPKGQRAKADDPSPGEPALKPKRGLRKSSTDRGVASGSNSATSEPTCTSPGSTSIAAS